MGVVSRPDRLQVMLKLKMIDDWRFLKRMPSRASAVRELLKRGLVADGFELADSFKRFRLKRGYLARHHTEKRASANGMVRPCSCPASD
jgi:hypothetical protein